MQSTQRNGSTLGSTVSCSDFRSTSLSSGLVKTSASSSGSRPCPRVVRERTYNTCVRSWAGLQPAGFGDEFNNPDMISVKQAIKEELVELIPSWLCGGDEAKIESFINDTKLSRTQLLHEVHVYSYGCTPPGTIQNGRVLDGGGLTESFWEFFRTKYLSGHRVIRNSKEKKERGIDGAVTYVEPDFDDGKFKYRTLVLDGAILQKRKKMDNLESLCDNTEEEKGGGVDGQCTRWLKKALSNYFMAEFEVANRCEEGGRNEVNRMHKIKNENPDVLVEMGKRRINGFRRLTTSEIYDVLEIQMSAGWENVPLPCGMDESRNDPAKYLLFRKPMECQPPLENQTGAEVAQHSATASALVGEEVEQEEEIKEKHPLCCSEEKYDTANCINLAAVVSKPRLIPRLDMKIIDNRGSMASRMTAASLGTQRHADLESYRSSMKITERASLDCCLSAEDKLALMGGGSVSPYGMSERNIKRRAATMVNDGDATCRLARRRIK
eukprot:GHVS01065154.1.p1 GENE.GHVS01065154.1~~GHVS01065154.1.p1  ORF type:complete len:495 (+),score=79.59 GHVS01065154.1:291-1775(+)